MNQDTIRIKALAVTLFYPKVWQSFRAQTKCRIRYKCKDREALGLGGKPLYDHMFTGTGTFVPFEQGGLYELTGYWAKPDEFHVENVHRLLPEAKEDVLDYLKAIGIRSITAQKLWDAFHDQVFEVLDTHPAALFEVDGISEKRASSIVTNYQNARYACTLYTDFDGVLPKQKAEQISLREKDGATAYVAVHPHRAYMRDDLPFDLAEYIFGWVERTRQEKIRALIDSLSPEDLQGRQRERAQACLLRCVRISEGQGHLYISRKELLSRAHAQSRQEEKMIDEQMLSDLLDRMLQAEDSVLKEYVPSGQRDALIYTTRAFEAENEVAERLAGMQKTVPVSPKALEGMIRKQEQKLGFQITAEQKHAVIQGLSHCVAVITGGPGTGKTTIVQYIVSLYEKMFPSKEVVLCAPTGKAARRLSESARREAGTIHSVFGLKVGSRQESVPPVHSADLVIVDESSMIDIYLMNDLLKALKPDVSLILVGDCNQLPSVGPGNVLGDLIASASLPVAVLSQVKRQKGGSSIPYYANLIKQKQFYWLDDSKLPLPPDFQLLETANEAESQRVILEQFEEAVRVCGMNEVIVLSPKRKPGLPTSCEDLNQRLQEAVNPYRKDEPEAVFKTTVSAKVFRLRDRVMQTVNTEYAMNGEVGIIVSLRQSKAKGRTGYTAKVDFGRGELASVSDEDLSRMELAYATTVHKSQGSEYQTVIVSMQNTHDPLLLCNLLYTAVTRAKKKVVIVGEKSAVETAIQNDQAMQRRTCLAAKIRRKSLLKV